VYKRCVTEQSARRQRELEAGLLSVMSNHRYEDITITDLCTWLHIPRKSFYRYFSSKEGALYALIDHTLMQFSVDFFAAGTDATYQTLQRFFDFWALQDKLLDTLARNDLSGLLVQRAIALASAEEYFPRSFFPDLSRHTREYVVQFVISGLISMVIQWHQSEFQYSAHKMANIAAHLLTQPLFSPSEHSASQSDE